MNVWMVYDREGLARNESYVSLFRRHFQMYGFCVEAVVDEQVKQKISAGERPFCVFVRTIDPPVNRFFETEGIPVFNSYEVSRICNDKGHTLARFRDRVLSVPSITLEGGEWERVMEQDGRDLSSVRRYFSDRFSFHTSSFGAAFEEQERDMIERAEDFVLKTVDGHGGSEVYRFCREQERIRAACQQTAKGNAGGRTIAGRKMVLQPLIKNGCQFQDMRVYVIGKRIAAAVMRSSSGDFRANYSRGADVALVKLRDSQAQIVNRITGELEFGMAGIDFLFDRDGNMVLNEIEDVAGSRMLYECAPHIDIVSQYVAYVMSCL